MEKREWLKEEEERKLEEELDRGGGSRAFRDITSSMSLDFGFSLSCNQFFAMITNSVTG